MTFTQNALFGRALLSSAVNDETVTGDAIDLKDLKGAKELTFCVHADAVHASATITIGVELSNDGSTFVDMYKEDGSTSMTFTAQAAAACDLVTAGIYGSIDLTRLSASDSSQSTDPTHIRLTATNDHASDSYVGATYVATGLRVGPSGTTDTLLADQLAAL